MKDLERLEKILGLWKVDSRPYQEIVREKLTNKGVLCLFPAGVGSSYMAEYLDSCCVGGGIRPDFISDNDERKLAGELYGLPCITVEDLWKQKGDDVTFLVESLHYHEIKRGLKEKGFTDIRRVYCGKMEATAYMERNRGHFRKEFLELMGVLSDERSKDVVETIISGWIMEDIPDDYFSAIYDRNQYFDSSIVRLSEAECFVDCGAYTGDTTVDFLQRVTDFNGTIYQFELDPSIYKELCNKMEVYKGRVDIVSFPYGVSDKESEVIINSGDRSSRILSDADNNSNTIKGKVVSLDEVLKDKMVTFIKMDVEGSEWAALHGAKKLIQEQHPALSICLYHKPEDLFRIPLYIKSLMPEYQIFIRHYTDLLWETVCYAIPPR